MIGRSTALLAGLAVDLQPAGWRLTDGSGRDHRLAIATLRSDLDLLEEHAQGYLGPLKYSVAGPWTLAATMERPRGDRVLADSGARRDLAQSLAEGVAELAVEMRRRLPGTAPLVQLDEPLLPSRAGRPVPTASGFSRHRVGRRRPRSACAGSAGRTARRSGRDRCWCTAAPPIRRSTCCTVAGVRGRAGRHSTSSRRLTGTPSAPALETGSEVGLGARPTKSAADRRPAGSAGAAPTAGPGRGSGAERSAAADPGMWPGRDPLRRRSRPCATA